ncbi:MAG: MFS transporter [Actinomycetota bacterium]
MTPDVRRALVATFVARTAANAGLRVVYPFLPAIARGLGVAPAALASLVAIRNLGGITTPVAARASERYGRRWMMIVAIAAVTVASILSFITDVFWIAGIGIIVVGLAKPAFDIPMQAWFGDRVPYDERGRVFGITELTWSVALLVTVPASGFLIVLTDWRAPFVLVAVLAGCGTFAIIRGIDSDTPLEHVRGKLKLTSPRVRMLSVALLFSVAAEIPFIVYGQWLEGSFGLSVAGIGTFTLVVVAAELAGEGLVIAFADRWGLRRMILGGLWGSAAAYSAFALTGSRLLLATIVVMVWIAAFEVTIVAAIPFVSELATARDRLLSLLAVTIAVGRALGALVGQPLFAAGGIGLVGFVSAACVAVSAVLLLEVEEPREAAPSPTSPVQ